MSNTGRRPQGEKLIYRGTSYYIQSSGRYFQSRYRVHGERLLHRRVWAERNGPIPEGMNVHHKDEDWRNNHIDNLELVEAGAHQRLHMKKRSAAGEKDIWVEYLKLAQVEAAKWHATSEGVEWHSENAKKMWEGRKSLGAICTRCKGPYLTYFPTRSRFCSRSCEQAEGYQRHKTSVRACDWCGKTFVANKYRTTACCSRECGNRKRAAEQKLAA